MSVWYSVDVTAYGDDRSLARLLNLNPEDVHHLDQVELSFGHKNGPGIDLEALVKANPDLIFLIESTVECFSGSVWLTRYDKLTEKTQDILLESFSYENREFNRKIVDEYPDLLHQFKNHGSISWKGFCYDDNKTRELLSRAEQYEDMSSLIQIEDIEFDNIPLEEV